MNLFELAAKLTLDSSDYEKGIEAAKQAAANFSKGLSVVVTAVSNADRAVNNAADSAENLGQSATAATNGVGDLSDTVESVTQAVRQSSDSMEGAADSAENLSSSADRAAESVENVEEAAADTTPKISLFDRTIQALQDRLGELQEANEALGDDFGVLGRAIEAVKQPFNAVGELFGKLKNKFIEFAGSAKETAENGINNIIIEFNLLKLKAEPLIEQFGKLKTKFIDLMASGKALAESGINKIFDGVKTASEKLSAVFDKVKNQFVSVADSARKFAEGALNNIKIEFNLIAAKAAPLIAQFDKLKSKIGELISSGKNLVESSINKIKNGFNSVVDSARKLGERGFNSIQIGLINVALKVPSLVGQFDRLKAKISDLTTSGKTLAENGFSKIKNGIDTVKSKFDVFKSVLDKAKSKIQEVTDKGKSLAESGFSKIQSGIEKVKSKFEPAINVFSKAKGWLEKLKDRFKKVGDEEDKTSEKTSRFGDIVKGMLTADAIKAGLGMLWSGIKRVGQAFIDIGKQAVDAYGNYEQLAGGIKKLYGDASKEVMNNAKQAYLTSGMSANQYMEQSTKFSAALINSLGGDTKEAARLTDVAMRSIADNFNTFGTDIESVQNAFQGFAKGNYTMLDNLSLGYGGTKKGMERLISDANKYAKTIGETSNLSIDSFADIVKAIELVQKKQGIYETTSKEAATTIQGSLNMTKAAWENLLVAIADEDADFDTAIDNLIESATAAGQNLIPRIEQVIKGMGRAIEKLLPIALSEAPKAIARYAPEVLESVKSLFSVIYNSLQNLLTETDWNALGGKISDGINNIDWATLFSYWAQNFGAQLVATLNLLSGFIENVDWYKLGEDIINSVLAMVENIDWGAVISKTFELLGAALGGLQSLADGLAQAAWDAIKAGFEATKNYFNKYIEDAGGNVIEGLFNGIINALSSIGSWIYNNIFKPFIDGFKNAFGIHSPSTVMQTIGKFIVEGFINPIKELPGKVWNWLVETIVKIANWGMQMRAKAIEAAKNFLSNLVNGIKELPGKIWGFLVSTVMKISNFCLELRNKATEAAKNFFNNLVNGLKSLPSKMAEIGTNVVKGIWNGIKNVKDWILNKIKGFGKGVLDGIKKAFGIASPSKYTAEDGKFLVQGLAKGILDNAADAKKAAAKLSNDVLSAFNSDGLAMAVDDLPDLNTDISASLTASNATMNTESTTDRLLMMILETLTQLDDGMKDKIKSAVDGMGFNWNDREVGRFVKTYA